MKSQHLAMAVVLVVGSTAAAQPATTADLLVRARQILVKHCAECHGEKPTPSNLGVLDHSKLLAKTDPVPLVRARDASASQLLDLIEEGSMPPGNRAKVSPDDAKILRAWIESGAEAYPIRFDDEFAYRTILADVKKRPAAELKNTRYLTLHHLAADGSNADLSKARAEFVAGVKSVIIQGAPGPKALDPAETVFRLDMDKVWARKRFTRLDDKGNPTGNALGNLYDFVLLEYPHGVVPRQSAAFDELVPQFLATADQVRPFAFVRGDWFVDVVTTAPLGDDLKKIIANGDVVPPGLKVPKPRLPLRPEAGAIAPNVVALPALDAWHDDDLAAHRDSPAGFTTNTYDKSLNQVKTKFVAGDRLRLRYGADVDAYFEYIWIDGANMIAPSEVLKVNAKTRAEKSLPDNAKETLLYEGNGDERFWVYASPHKYAPGEIWRATPSNIERYVHPFFAIKEEGGKKVVSTDDAKIARKTIKIKIAPEK